MLEKKAANIFGGLYILCIPPCNSKFLYFEITPLVPRTLNLRVCMNVVKLGVLNHKYRFSHEEVSTRIST